MEAKQITAIAELKQALEETLTPNILIYIYQRIRILTEIPSKPSPFLSYPPLIRTIRFFLVDRDREVRVAALRTLRYMSLNEEILHSITSAKLQSFIIRCFETEGKNQEKIEACKFIKNWLEISPDSFPRSFMNALIALAETENEELKEFAVEAIRILCVSNPKLVALCGGVKVLVGSLSDGQIFLETHINTILTLVYLLNTQETRRLLVNSSEILKIFAVFTNSDSIYSENEFNCLLALGKQAIKTMCRSWVGLLFLASSAFKPVFNCLTLPCDVKIKVAILETLEEILNLPIDTSPSCRNLLKNYLALMIRALLDSDVISSLNSVIGSGNQKLSLRCRAIVQKIFLFATDLLPANTLEVFNTLTPYSQLPEKRVLVKTPEKNSNFLFLCCEYLTKEPHNYIESSFVVTQEIYNNYLITTIEGSSILDLVRCSRVLEDSNKWNWKLISMILSVADKKLGVFSQLFKEKFFHSLVNYFSPSRKKFSVLSYHPDNFGIANVGRKLFWLLIRHDEGIRLLIKAPVDDFFMIRVSLIEELKVFLELEMSKKNGLRLFTAKNVAGTMMREYLKWIALLTYSGYGKNFLVHTGLDMSLLNLSTIPYLAAVVLPYLNYSEQLSKDFISISLQSPSNTLKQLSIQQIHLLYKAKKLDLAWAVKELVSLFHYNDQETARSALNIVKELCSDPSSLQAFIETGPQDLSKLGEEGKSCLLSLLSCESGVEYLKTLNFIQTELDSWTVYGHESYIKRLEHKSESGLFIDSKTYALEIFTPFTDSIEDRADGLWLSRIPFFICIRVPGRDIHKKLTGVVQVLADEICIKSFDLCIGLVEGDVIEACLMVGSVFISNQGNECENGNWIRIEVANREVQENFGVVVNCVMNDAEILFKGCSFRVKVLPKISQKIEFPVHLYAELAKTEAGIRVLKDRIDVEEFVRCLEVDNSLLCKRVALWALGNIGTSEIGAKYLGEMQAVKGIVRIAEESETLSLRGTGFQVLCLISSTKTGRKLIKNEGWAVSKSKIAVPFNTKKIFSLKEVQDFWLFHERTRIIEAGLKCVKLTKEEQEVLENILNVSNFARKNEAEEFIRTKRHQSPEIFENLRLFSAVMVHLELFHFGLKTRKMVHKIFDKVHRRQGNLEELDEC